LLLMEKTMESATYSVVLSGNILSGFETDTVTSALAEMLNLASEEAAAAVTSRFVVKKEVELHVAKNCKEELAEIGIDAQLQRHGGVGELSLAPMQDDNLPADETDDDGLGLPGSEIMVCPKCELKQDRADSCAQCGVYIHKIILQAAETEASRSSGTVTAAAAMTGPTASVVRKRSLDKKKAASTEPWVMPVLLFVSVAVLGFLFLYIMY
jgi:hypothetical protein